MERSNPCPHFAAIPRNTTLMNIQNDLSQGVIPCRSHITCARVMHHSNEMLKSQDPRPTPAARHTSLQSWPWQAACVCMPAPFPSCFPSQQHSVFGEGECFFQCWVQSPGWLSAHSQMPTHTGVLPRLFISSVPRPSTMSHQ